MTSENGKRDPDCPFAEKVLLKSISSSISEGVLAVDLELNVLFFNPSAERITGVKQEEALGRPYAEIIHEETCQTLCAIGETLASGNPITNRSLHLVQRNGKKIPISISTSLVRDSMDRIIGGMAAIRDLSEMVELRREIEGAYSFHHIVGKSEAMRRIFSTLPPMAQSEATVLIQGESGTGKELVAHALHHESPRREGPLVIVNCGALPETLLESELFGYRAGAFTDARKDKPGQVTAAEMGILFLDEIGEMSPGVQAKFLRLLQEKTYHPLGAMKPVKADVRFIAATNRTLKDEVAKGRFREDLFYRLSVLNVTLPPLRERREDIPLLVDHMIERFNRVKGRQIEGMAGDVLQLLIRHPFAGNVRELENILEHAFALCPGGIIETDHLPQELVGSASAPEVPFSRNMNEVESQLIVVTLEKNDWNRRATAKTLGMHPSTLYRKIRALGIETPRRDGRARPRK